MIKRGCDDLNARQTYKPSARFACACGQKDSFTCIIYPLCLHEGLHLLFVGDRCDQIFPARQPACRSDIDKMNGSYTYIYIQCEVYESSSSLYAAYLLSLNARLVDWSEKHGLRSPSQAGFRPGRSTVHHLFALRHFIDHAKLAKRALYTCFVDLQKAYDTVQHDLLWGRLRLIGVSPRMLAAIQSLYATRYISDEDRWHSWPASCAAHGGAAGVPA